MNSIKQEQNTTIKIYREFFTKSEIEVKKQLLALKSPSYCQNCHKCCEIRYSELSIQELQKNGYEEFLDNFILIGTDEKTENISIEENHQAAFSIDSDYVNLVCSKSDKNVWFYTCKHFQNNECQAKKEKPLYCNSYPNQAYFILHNGCGYKFWQKEVLNKLENQMARDILEKIQVIDNYKNEFSCSCCATCCKIASSEFSYEELKEKAKNGDHFAKQFVSVFIPYKDEIEPRKAYGEYIDYLYETLGEKEKFYFYYCPKNKDNKCSDYENRPDICKDFPSNPLMILPKSCGFKPWQQETHTATLLLHALVEIVDFYIKKMKKII